MEQDEEENGLKQMLEDKYEEIKDKDVFPIGNSESRKTLEKVFVSGDMDKTLENSEKLMNEDPSSNVGLRAELTYVQMGIIEPLANEFLEAAGLIGGV